VCRLDGNAWWLAGCRRAPVSRRHLLGGALGLAGGLALSAAWSEAQASGGSAAPGSGAAVPDAGPAASAAAGLAAGPGQAQGRGQAIVRWLGGGVLELATPDYGEVAYVDAWLWNNTGWRAFGRELPAEYSTAAGFRSYLQEKRPSAVLVALTHDHGDHMGDFFEVLSTLADTGLNVRTTGQSDLMRAGLVQRFRDAGINPQEIVLNNGNAMNFGGRVQHGSMRAILVPAVHSTLLGYPAAGFILELGGIRFYLSGDTDLYSDLRLVGERYRPDVAVVCAGNGPFTMDPEGAAWACEMLGVAQAIPVHYAHNPLVMGPDTGETFRRAVAARSPSTTVHVMQPGDSITINN
jgi:L-ascorbate metabolism protein UlaG (beta-lactamase superfamily)